MLVYGFSEVARWRAITDLATAGSGLRREIHEGQPRAESSQCTGTCQLLQALSEDSAGVEGLRESIKLLGQSRKPIV